MKVAIQLLLLICANSLFAQQAKLHWAAPMGGQGFDIGKCVALDPWSNVYSAGNFEGIADFDPSSKTFSLTGDGNYSDVYISKQDPLGHLIWAKQVGGPRIQNAYGITSDIYGNVFVTGIFEGTTDFDPSTATYNLTSKGSRDIFIMKLDANGTFKFAKQVGGLSYDEGTSIAIDSIGNIYVTGTFTDSMDVDPGAGVHMLYSHGKSDIFILKLNAAGNFVWAQEVGGTQADYSTSIKIDRVGNVLASGYFKDTVDFDPSLIGVYWLINPPPPFSTPPIIDYNVFVLKLDSAGNFNWARQMGGEASTESYAMALDTNNAIYTTGGFESSADFDPDTSTTFSMTSTGVYNVFVSKLNADGTFAWAKEFECDGTSMALSIDIDTTLNVYTTGNFSNTCDFDPSSSVYNKQVQGFNTNAFISKLNAQGNFVWAAQLEGDGGASGIAVSSKDSSVFVTGGWAGTIDFDPSSTHQQLQKSYGLFDAYTLKLSQCQSVSDTSYALEACDSLRWNNQTITQSGTYWDTTMTDFGCELITTLKATIHKITMNLTSTNCTCSSNSDGSISVVGTALSYLLLPNNESSNSGIFSNLTAGIYTVQGSDESNCITSQEVTLTQKSCCENLFVPTAFTPNGDGANDQFKLLNTGDVELKHFQVFNRWGQQVFETNAVQAVWDGTLKGHPLGMDTYYYVLQYKCLQSGKEYVKKGDITLIR